MRLKRFARKFGLARLYCLLLLIALAALHIADPFLLEELRLSAFDAFQRIKPRTGGEKPVVIVDIDEKSLAQLGQWPWPRTRVADLVRALTERGAVVIGFDIMFAEADRLSPDRVADSLHGLDAESRARLRALPDNDKVLADAIAPSRVVLGETGLPYVVKELDQNLPVTGLALLGPDPKQFMFKFPGLLRNVPVLEQAAAGRGLLTIRPERDGIVRRVPFVMMAQGIVMPSLSFEMLRVATGASTILVRSDAAGIRSVALQGVQIPTDRNGQIWVHFRRHDRSLYVSAADVLDGHVPAGTFDGKLVLVGTSAAGLLDIKTTPVSRVMPGVEVHAQILESVLAHSVLSQPNYAILLELAIAIVLGLAVIWLAPLFGPVTLFVLGTIVVAALLGMSWYFYSEQQLLIDSTYPLVSTLAIYLTLVFSSYVREQSQRRRIRSAFSQYLSPALVEQLAQSPEKLVLGGEEREMTIMFSDVRGFTAISESYRHDPQGLTALMNRFLTPLTNAILDRKGTIDKYMGDAIMAFWNAPLDDPAHEVNACDAALDMLDEIAAVNRAREDESRHGGHAFIPLNIGIGINTGTCVVGNMGSDQRFDYSVLGDSVNLASRIEGQSKTYGFPVIAGSRTALAVKDRFAIVELDFIMVKGKREPEMVYAVAGRADLAREPAFQACRDNVIDLLARYRSRDWDGAMEAIAAGRGLDGASRFGGLYDLYAARIDGFRTDPPPPDWNGAVALLTK